MTRSTSPREVGPVQRFPRIASYRQAVRRFPREENFACETIYFACELENFACERILFRQAPRKLLKSLRREIYDFAVSCDFRGLRPILFRAFLAVRFSIRQSGLARVRFSFSEFVSNTNSNPGKAKRGLSLHNAGGDLGRPTMLFPDALGNAS
jgi:hypothetical protein